MRRLGEVAHLGKGGGDVAEELHHEPLQIFIFGADGDGVVETGEQPGNVPPLPRHHAEEQEHVDIARPLGKDPARLLLGAL